MEKIINILVLSVEDIFFKTGQISSANTVAAGKWPLMTRAHLAQALISVALAEKEDDATVSYAALLNIL